MPLAEFAPATPARDRPQTLVLDRSAIGIGNEDISVVLTSV
jgi:hypothetical protein